MIIIQPGVTNLKNPRINIKICYKKQSNNSNNNLKNYPFHQSMI
jgi:hypothetical protein